GGWNRNSLGLRAAASNQSAKAAEAGEIGQDNLIHQIRGGLESDLAAGVPWQVRRSSRQVTALEEWTAKRKARDLIGNSIANATARPTGSRGLSVDPIET